MSNCNLRETTAITIKLVLNILAFSDILTSIQDPRVEVQAYSVAWVNPVYLKSWEVENPDIFRTLPYSQPSYIENLGAYRTRAYLDRKLNELHYLRFIKGNHISAFCSSKKTLKSFYFQTILCSSQHLALQHIKRSHPKTRNPCSAYENPWLI